MFAARFFKAPRLGWFLTTYRLETGDELPTELLIVSSDSLFLACRPPFLQ